MGMYDIVLIPCPNCRQTHKEQIKTGDCDFTVYKLGACPSNVICGLDTLTIYTCDNCKTQYKIGMEAFGYTYRIEKD